MVSGSCGAVVKKGASVLRFAPAMLPKKIRLPVGAFLGKRGRTFRSPLFTLKIFPPSLPFARFGVVIGKRVSKTAVGRNAARRKFFDVASHLPVGFPVADYLIIAQPGAEKATLKELYDQLFSTNTS